MSRYCSARIHISRRQRLAQQNLVHKQIRLPPVVEIADEVTNESDMAWTQRLPDQPHSCFVRGLVSLPVIAAHTGTDKIFPNVLASPRFRNYVVNCYREIAASAVLATMPISPQDILARENYLLERHVNKNTKPYYTRERHHYRDRANAFTIMRFNKFSFSQV